MKFISKESWILKSPDEVSMDFFTWGYLKRQLWKYKPKDMAGLKRDFKKD
jgi:hypothetical protein